MSSNPFTARDISDEDSALGHSEISPDFEMSEYVSDVIAVDEKDSYMNPSTHYTVDKYIHSGFGISLFISSILTNSISWARVAIDTVQQKYSHGPFIPKLSNIIYYKHLLGVASTYEQWHAAAHQLDRLEENEGWKDDPVSKDYDYKLIMNRLSQLRRARESGDIDNMIFLLRTSLSRNIGDIGNPSLYCRTRVGTKKIIEDYIDEVNRQMKLICEASEIDSNRHTALSLENKLDFFLNTRQAFGRTALLLSGGATFGLNHIGVIKALHDCKLLPRIISGSSVGSLMAALVCSKTDSELFDYLHDEDLNLNALESTEEEGNLFFKISRFIKHGVIFDVEVLKDCVRSNIGDVTFQDAYNRTRRILNITVSSSTKYEMPRLLNYLTAPNVLIWSAVAASCAIPFVYKSAPLMARDKHGAIVPWNPSGHRWIDGSVENDLPMLRLSELFNVNHFIVCQVNPHVVPFLPKTVQKSSSSPFVSSLMFLAKSELNHRLSQLAELDIFPTTLHRLQNIISQRYYGDITIVPDVTPKDYLQLVTNPSKESLWQFVIKGERATWPQIRIIRNHCSIELALDDIIYRLRCRKLEASVSNMINQSSHHDIANHMKYGTLHNPVSPGVSSLYEFPEYERSPPISLNRSHSVGRGMNQRLSLAMHNSKNNSKGSFDNVNVRLSMTNDATGNENDNMGSSQSDPSTPLRSFAMTSSKEFDDE